MIEPPERLLKVIEYQFTDQSLLVTALTHRSTGSDNNERLEFLGDAILGFVIADELYQRFPKSDEGQLSRLRASLVKKETLATLARSLHLGKYLMMGAGELRSGGHARDSILADALEALFGSVFLDGGYDEARKVVLFIYQANLNNLTIDAQIKDPKTRLQEYLQGQGKPLPQYTIVEVQGDQHEQIFISRCQVPDSSKEYTGKGTSRRRAEQAVAELILEELLRDKY